MSDELVEALANTLYDAYCGGPRLRTEHGLTIQFTLAEIRGDRDGSDEMSREPWRQAARECIRQMEWARRECVESEDSYQAGNSWLVQLELTLAPEGWTP